MIAPRRNDPCPCGSGRRYKECHGSVDALSRADGAPVAAAIDAADLLVTAATRLATGDIAGAETLARNVLRTAPDHPEALRIVGRCDFEHGEPAAALDKLLAAARSMQTFPSTAQQQYAIWTDLGLMFTQALSGMDIAAAGGKRTEYWRSRAAKEDKRPAETPLVSIVLVASDPMEWTLDALRSVCRQTYANIELVIVEGRASTNDHRRIEELLAGCSFPRRRVHIADGADESSRINAGVRAASGAFVNVLEAGDRFGDARIATFVREIADGAGAWGFGDVAFVDVDGATLRPERDPTVARAVELLAGIAEADTVGFSLIHQSFVAVATGNLFFSRELFDRLGGFRASAHNSAWDFALRALWLEEPVYVAAREYTRRVSAQDAPALTQAQAERSHVAMFKEFYERACSDAVAPNAYAPSVQHWRMHFLKIPFQVGHVLAFPLELLEKLGKQIIELRATAAAGEALPGVNLVGFAYGEFGLAENLRALAKACVRGGIPFVVRDVDMRLKARQADRSLQPHIVDTLRHACSIFCLNPDMLKPVEPLMKSAAGARRYNVGYWFWELERLPREWTYAIDRVDEVWVATDFVASAVRHATSKPVIKVPTPIEVKLSRPYTRAEFALPEDKFLFLFSFDFNSFVIRKNPEGAIAAFKRAFGRGRHDVGMVVKSINSGRNPEKLRDIRALIGDDDRILISDGFLSRDQVFGLHSVVDAYVSLHRAEGLGLGLAESMYLGKPSIATAYSGNLEFMSPDNSCLVGYELVPVEKGQYLYDDERFRWAEPDLEQASQWMVKLVDDVEFRERIAQRGRRDIRARLNYASAAAVMRGRLTQLGLL